VLILGEAIAKRLDLPFVIDAVRRVRVVPELKDMHDYNERMQLLEGAHAADPNRVRGHRILLVDDLFRSGATMNAITASLYDQGHAADVYALTITSTRGK
jgi:predicted amidophosphoribosyltransferase